MNDLGLSDRRTVLCAAASLLALSACNPLFRPEETPGQIYVLSPALPSVAGSAVRSSQLAVALPHASASLMTNRIALRRDQTLDYYADAQWMDSTPQLLQNLLIEALEKSGALSSVAKDVDGIHADFVLQSEINAFEARYVRDEAPTIVVDLTIKVVSVGRGEIANAREFHEESVAAANSMRAVVTGFDSALSALLPKIARWVLDVERPLKR
jgi:cholesterol transport system auxiliary component